MICYKCDLCTNRKNIVWGYGNTDADIMFIGEAPGYYEDKSGVPFVGQAGQLLDKYLQLCNFNREDIFITNVIRCKPPDNRTPTNREIYNCREHLHREIKMVKPKMVILLGSTAFYSFFKWNGSLSDLRGIMFPMYGVHFLLTYHPSYILRNPNMMRTYFKHFDTIVKGYRKYVDLFHSVNY